MDRIANYNNLNIKKLEQELIKKPNKSFGSQVSEVGVKKDFSQVLSEIGKSSGLKFSKHAQERLSNRNIALDAKDINKLDKAFDKAEMKGIRDALILIDGNAFIASVENKTVITAVDKKDLKDNIFTNIDGAVII